MSSIGGYFELELQKSDEYHHGAVRLNTGRNALEYVLKAKKYKKIYLPFYTCDVLLQPIKRLNLKYEFYNINEKFEPVFDFTKILVDECFLYTNYFGLKDSFIETLPNFCENLIIDNAQAFFSKPIPFVDTFYSPRKFIGVSDGAYLYCNKHLHDDFEQDFSYKRMSHLLIRMDTNVELGYSDFKNNEIDLDNLPIKKMSQITKTILSSIDYKKIADIRKENFHYINKYLETYNLLKWDLIENSIPMVYPFYTNKLSLKSVLLQNKIYTATYWPNVLEWAKKDSIEMNFAINIINLPIDQRITKLNLDEIIEKITYEYKR